MSPLSTASPSVVSDGQRQPRRVDPLAAEEPLVRVPRKEDHDLPAEAFARGREAEPIGDVRAGHLGLLTDSLRADDDVRQVEVDVREGGEQLRVEARRAVVALPAVAGLDELVDAVVGQRRDQAREVAAVLGDRVLLPELANLLVLGRLGLAPDQFADVGQVASQNARTRSLKGPPSFCGLCAAGKTARCACRRSWSTSQTARNAAPASARAESGAGHQSPCTSRTRKPTRSSSSSGICASHGGRSVIDARAAASASPSSVKSSPGKPKPRRNAARYSEGSSRVPAAAEMLRINSSTASSPR